MLNSTDHKTTKRHLEQKIELLKKLRESFTDKSAVAKFHALRKQHNVTYETLFDNFSYTVETPEYSHYNTVIASLDTQFSKQSAINLINRVYGIKNLKVRDSFIALIDAQKQKFEQELAELPDPINEEEVTKSTDCSTAEKRILAKISCGMIGAVLMGVIAPVILEISLILAIAIAIVGALIILCALCGLTNRLFPMDESQEKPDDSDIETIPFNAHPSVHNYHSIFNNEVAADIDEKAQPSSCFDRFKLCQLFS